MERVDALLELIQDIAVAANQAQTARAAFRTAVRRICEYADWFIGHVYLRAEDESGDMVSSGIWHCAGAEGSDDLRNASLKARFPPHQDIIWKVVETGEPVWIEEIATVPDWPRGSAATAAGLNVALMFPITVTGQVVGVMEFYAGGHIELDERFKRTMKNVGIQLGYVVERERLERRIAELADGEQRRIGEDLHDGLGQQITAVAMLASSLQQKLAQKGLSEAEDADRVVASLDDARDQISALIQGLIPFEVRAADLSEALQGLAARSTSVYEIECSFENSDPITVARDSTATQLYRIAREAIHNAVKHGKADAVIMSLERDSAAECARLTIRDNGCGLDPKELQYSPQGKGMGIQIMRHRASLIGGDLKIESTPGEGTLVECGFTPDA